MKFCYADESGHEDGVSQVFVMAGVIVDAQRMRPTKRDWEELLRVLSKGIGKPVPELKSNAFYRGQGIWKGLDGPQRSTVFDEVVDWLNERKHGVTFTAIDLPKYRNLDDAVWETIGPKKEWTPWKLGAVHFVLGVQKAYKGHEKNKGNTLMVFDRQVREELALAALVSDPPSWTESFYGGVAKGKEPLDQVIDVPYFADSRHVGLLQAADFCALLLRLHAEFEAGYLKEAYAGEAVKVAGWVRQLTPRCLPDAIRWPKSKEPCASLFASIAPDALRTLPK